MKPTLLVLAAGMGSRYGGLKQMDPIGPSGETLLDYAVFDAMKAGFGSVTFVIRRDFEDAFKKRVDDSFGKSVEVRYAFQSMDDLPGGRKVPEGRAKPWGTAHAVRAARDVVNEPFAMINADDFYGRDAYVQMASLLNEFNQSRTPLAEERVAMVGYRLDRTLSENGSVARGICKCDADGNLMTVTEHTKIAAEGDGIFSTLPDGSKVRLVGDEAVSMNFWGFPPSLFAILEEQFGGWLDQHINEPKGEWYVPLVVNTLLEQKRAKCKVLNTSASWFGVTYREDRPGTVAAVAALTRDGVYPERLWK